MKIGIIKWSLMFFAATSVATSASAMEVNLHGVLNVVSPSLENRISPSVESSGGASVGAGVSIGCDFAQLLGLEAGLLYLPQEFTATLGATSTETKTKYLQVPLVVRLRAVPGISVGLGGYFGRALGDVEVKTTAGGLSVTGFVDRDQAGISSTDWGALVSIQAVALDLGAFRLYGEGRYALGLRDIETTDGIDVKYRNFQAFLGVSLGI